MSGLSDLALWNRIRSFELDKADIGLPFSARLARENDWDLEFARRVCEEYKKFIYLVCISDQMVTPSVEVDEAWHLHLVYTKSYWRDFCGDVLWRDLHHIPTEGGMQEGEKFNAAYERTLALYKQQFGEDPPVDIWPSAHRRFAQPTVQKVDTRDYVMFRRSDGLFAVVMGGIVALCLAAFLFGTPWQVVAFALLGGLIASAEFTLPFARERKKKAGKAQGGAGCGGGGGCGGGNSGCGGGGCGGGS